MNSIFSNRGITATFDIWALFSGFFQVVKVTGAPQEVSKKALAAIKTARISLFVFIFVVLTKLIFCERYNNRGFFPMILKKSPARTGYRRAFHAEQEIIFSKQLF